MNHHKSKPKTAYYKWCLDNDGWRFDWVQARQALCNVELTRVKRLEVEFMNMRVMKGVDEKTMLIAFAADEQAKK